MEVEEVKIEDVKEDFYIDIQGEKKNIRVNHYHNRYYVNNNDIFITDYVDECGKVKYRDIKVKKNGCTLYKEEYVGSKIVSE